MLEVVEVVQALEAAASSPPLAGRSKTLNGSCSYDH